MSTSGDNETGSNANPTTTEKHLRLLTKFLDASAPSRVRPMLAEVERTIEALKDEIIDETRQIDSHEMAHILPNIDMANTKLKTYYDFMREEEDADPFDAPSASASTNSAPSAPPASTSTNSASSDTNSASASSNPTPSTSTSATAQSSTSSDFATINPSPNILQVKPMQLMSFAGEIRYWKPFWEQFSTLIHERNIDNTQKFAYLMSVLKGKARKVLEGFSLSAASYPEAINLLKERFGSPQKLISVYYSELASLKPSTSSEGQRNNLDSIRKIINNLRTVGTEVDQEYVKNMILKKFGPHTLRIALRKLVVEPNDTFTIEELMSALTQVISIEDLVHLYTADQDFASPSPSTNTPGPSRVFNRSLPVSALLSGKNSGASRNSCFYCDGSHPPQDCKKYATLVTRKARLTGKRLCFACGKSGHVIQKCGKKDEKCSFCKRSGHSLHLCVSYVLSKKKSDNTNERNPAKSGDAQTGMYLQTFTCHLFSNAVEREPVRGILDSGSSESYIHKKLTDRSNLIPKTSQNIYISPFGAREPVLLKTSTVQVELGKETGVPIRTFNLKTTPYITGKIETAPSVETSKIILPPHKKYADPDIFKPDSERKPLDILIGNDLINDVITGEIQKLPSGVMLIKSIFGWIPSGKIGGKSLNTGTQVIETFKPKPVLICPDINLNHNDNLALIANLWNLEALGIKSNENDATNDLVLLKFRETLRFERDRYIVRWPWKQENPPLPSNFRVSMARLKNLLLKTPKNVLEACEKLFSEQLRLQIIEPAPVSTRFLTHYLPHRPIFQHNKLRVVYDASAKTKTGKSLNDYLHCGPKLQEDIVGLLFHFRLEPVALTADIEKAFLQIELNEVDRDAVRFIWVKNYLAPPTPDNVVIFRFRRVPFGVVSSPFLLNIVIQEHLNLQPDNEHIRNAKHQFYVDNFVLSVHDTSTALNVYDSLTSRLDTASFNLRDWASNDEKFINAIPEIRRNQKEGKISILGLNWDRKEDVLFVKMNLENTPKLLTKRYVVSFLAAIFDPLGLFSPCTLELKILVQECWKEGFSWDKPLPPHLIAKWIKISNEAKEIAETPIPRRCWSVSGQGKIELNVFCDASKRAYACVVYLTYIDKATCQSCSVLIFSKTRIAPLKNATIPRLELLAVVIGKRVANFVQSLLKLSIDKVTLWTDATTVLQWLQSSAVLPKFVQNRVDEIRRSPNLNIRYVPSESNPADIASRGQRASNLKLDEKWWKGPNWLVDERLWPTLPENTEIFITPVLTAAIVKYAGVLTDELENRFSSWTSYVKFFSILYKFCFRKASKTLSPEELYEKGEETLIIELQKKYFPEEYNKLSRKMSADKDLNLYLEKGIIRCKGRIDNASLPWDAIHPMLLPRDGPLTNLYIRKIHEDNQHIGCTQLLAKIRERFWIIKGRAKINSFIHRCTTCRKWDGGAFQLPPMPPLPLVRVQEVAPFRNTGVDYLGPIYIKTDSKGRKVKTTKAYVALFTCLVTRAVHLELVRDLTAYEFLLALIEFTSRRGDPQIIISDNGTNFVCVQPLVSERVNTLQPELQKLVNDRKILWKFIPTHAPWYGGAYERLVAAVKQSLRKSFSTVYLDYVEMKAALAQIESTINSRPLTYVSGEILKPLTPNHFLRPMNPSPNAEITNRPTTSSAKTLVRGWSYIRGVIEAFWVAFRSHYLLSLRERHTSLHPAKKGSLPFHPSKGEIVLIKERSIPRAQWPYAVVLRLDSKKRLAYVRTDGKTVTRAVNQLVPLELPTDKINMCEEDGPPQKSAKIQE